MQTLNATTITNQDVLLLVVCVLRFTVRAKMPYCYNLAVSPCTRMPIHFVHVDSRQTPDTRF